jgi:hypothetical protein
MAGFTVTFHVPGVEWPQPGFHIANIFAKQFSVRQSSAPPFKYWRG